MKLVREVRRRATGALEAEVLAQLSESADALTPAEVLSRLDGRLAYTTVTTILTRLSDKGLVTRSRRGRGYAYELRVQEADVVAGQMRERLRLSGDPAGALRRFVTELNDDEADELRHILDQLEAEQ